METVEKAPMKRNSPAASINDIAAGGHPVHDYQFSLFVQ